MLTYDHAETEVAPEGVVSVRRLERSCALALPLGAASMGSRILCTLLFLRPGSTNGDSNEETPRAPPKPTALRAHNGARRAYECHAAVYGTLVSDVINAVHDHGVIMSSTVASIERELLEQMSRRSMLRPEERAVLGEGMCGARAIGAQRRTLCEQTQRRRRVRGQDTAASLSRAWRDGASLAKKEIVGMTTAIVLFYSAIVDGVRHAASAECLAKDGALRAGVLGTATEVLLASGPNVGCFDEDSGATRVVREEMRALARGLEALASPELRAALVGVARVDALRAEVATLRAAAWPAADSLCREDLSSPAAMDAAAVALGVRAGIAHIREPSISLAQLAPSRPAGLVGRYGFYNGSASSVSGSSLVSSRWSSNVSSSDDAASQWSSQLSWSPAKRKRDIGEEPPFPPVAPVGPIPEGLLMHGLRVT